jgi:ATP synthase subunit 6
MNTLSLIESPSEGIFLLMNPLEQFQIVPLIALYMGSMDFSFTNSALIGSMGVGFFILLGRIVLMEGNGNLVPSRWQTIYEGIYNLVSGLLSDNVGPRGQAFLPFIFVLFSFLLTSNLIGMVPYSFTITSHIIVTLFFSLMVYVGVMIILFREHKFHGMSLFLPPGAPIALWPLLIAIEFISNVMRVVSLSVRLFANMMAGHILLKVLLGFSWTMMMAGGALFILHFIPLGVVFVLLFLETAVAVIQAYVFATLTCIYLNESIHLH